MRQMTLSHSERLSPNATNLMQFAVRPAFAQLADSSSLHTMLDAVSFCRMMDGHLK